LAGIGCRTDSLFQMITPTAATRATNDAINTAVVGFRHTHFFPRVKTQCVVPELVRALASVPNLPRARERTSNGALNLSPNTSDRLWKARDLFSDSRGAVGEVRFPRPGERF